VNGDHRIALAELSAVLDGTDNESFETACQMICEARELLLYGCGREALQMEALQCGSTIWGARQEWSPI